MSKPRITVIVPVYNEARIIESALGSILRQKRELYDMELLVVDGGSKDGTREKIKAIHDKHPEVMLVDNEKRITPAAFNTGIRAATGEYIAILGAHAIYDENYLDTCLSELMKHGADGCSGLVTMALNESSVQSTMIYHLLTSSFGVSGNSYRTAPEGFSEHCPYPLFKKSMFDTVGLYNEKLARNQDNDMNHRLRDAGFRLYYTFKTSAYYYPKQTFKAILRYAYTSGIGNAISLRVNPRSMALRHFIPFIFMSSILTGLAGSILFYLLQMPMPGFFFAAITLLPVALHLLLGTVISFRMVVKTKKTVLLGLPLLMLLFHLCYGWGTAAGLARKVN